MKSSYTERMDLKELLKQDGIFGVPYENLEEMFGLPVRQLDEKKGRDVWARDLKDSVMIRLSIRPLDPLTAEMKQCAKAKIAELGKGIEALKFLTRDVDVDSIKERIFAHYSPRSDRYNFWKESARIDAAFKTLEAFHAHLETVEFQVPRGKRSSAATPYLEPIAKIYTKNWFPVHLHIGSTNEQGASSNYLKFASFVLQQIGIEADVGSLVNAVEYIKRTVTTHPRFRQI